MRNTLIGIILSLVLLSVVSCNTNNISGDVIITDVNIIDVVNGALISNQTVLIKNGEITSITPFSNAVEIDAESIIDGKGKYVMPSLWDMHAHYTTSSDHKGFLNLFIANGILGVRDLWGDLESRDSIEVSNTLAPTIYLSGAVIDGSFTLLQGSLQPRTPESAVNMVDSLHQKGADFIKVYDDLSVDIYKAIANRCHELDLPFAGHVPMSIKTEVASKMGQKSMEHLNGIWKSSSTLEKEIDGLEGDFKANFMSNNLPTAINTFITINGKINSTFDEQKTLQLAEILSSNGTYVTPTLTTIDKHWSRIDGTYKIQEQNKYVSDDLLKQWDPELNFPEKMFPPLAWETGKELLNTSLQITKLLHDKKVNILAGTDCGVSYVIPGFSIHDELKLLVEAGLSNAEVLKTVTLNPAKYFDLSDSIGQVKTGMIANLLLLNANPLDEISNTKKIFGVIRDGKYLNREYLDRLLKEAEIKK